ncbi:MAG: hypothetical protein ABIH72_00260 [archaeon]
MYDYQILQEKFEFEKGKHKYAFEPEGFNSKNEDGNYPVFMVDNKIILLDESLSNTYEGCAFLVCDCDDYQERMQRFESEESYKSLQSSPDFGWDCVATCSHITLIKRYFSKPLLKKTLDTLISNSTGTKKLANKFITSREAGIFPISALLVLADYLDNKAQSSK